MGAANPSRALIYVEVADPANISSVWYEYHVRTPVPFDGVNRSASAADDFRVWRGLIGPFEANPSNADEGPIMVTAHGVYRDGSERTVTATWSDRICRRSFVYGHQQGRCGTGLPTVIGSRPFRLQLDDRVDQHAGPGSNVASNASVVRLLHLVTANTRRPEQ